MRFVVRLLLVSAGFAVLAAGGQVRAQSVGFFPSAIELENALRGQNYELTTTLVNQTTEPRIFALQAAGDTAGWTTFATVAEPGTPIDQVMAPPESETRVLVTIAIPETAPNGDATGSNSYDGYTAETFESREGLVTGFQQPVRITVTGDQVLDMRVGDVSARNVEIGQPLRIRTQLNNRGNVDTSADLVVDFFPVPSDAATDRAIDTLEASLEVVRPGKSTTAESEWPTADRDPGRYRAEYTLTLDGARLGLGSFEFELLPPGSLARSGAIASMDVVRPVVPGAINRADVSFQNQGEVDSLARFAGHLYRDGVAIAVAESPDSLLVPPGGEVVFAAYFELPGDAPGDYEVRGRVYFEGSQTGEAVAAFSIAEPGEPDIVRWLALGGIAAVVLGTVVVGGAWAVRKR